MNSDWPSLNHVLLALGLSFQGWHEDRLAIALFRKLRILSFGSLSFYLNFDAVLIGFHL